MDIVAPVHHSWDHDGTKTESVFSAAIVLWIKNDIKMTSQSSAHFILL
jgi:hypothetical protein